VVKTQETAGHIFGFVPGGARRAQGTDDRMIWEGYQ